MILQSICCPIYQNIKTPIIVVELIRDTTENSFCRTLVSHESSFITNILCRYIIDCCKIYFTTLPNISPFCHQNTLLLSLAWCYTSCVCHPTIKLIGHTFIWHGCTSLATGHWQVISLSFSIQIFSWIFQKALEHNNCTLLTH